MQNKTEKRIRLKSKIRTRVNGTKEIPRFSVFRSNKFIYAQIIDDTAGKTLVSVSDAKIAKGAKMERASQVGQSAALGAAAQKISKVVFDRNGFKYTGRIKAVADGARAGGLKF